jgi:SAM-dependent methyltransferase
MSEPEFDQYAGDYSVLHQQSIAFSGCELEYFADYKARYAAECFREICRDGERLLDFGCGTGASIPLFGKYLDHPSLVCADVSIKSLELAERRHGAAAAYLPIRDERLELPADSVGMVFTSCVFHHIPPDRHGHWMAELLRVTRPGGAVVIFEHNPLNPLTRHAVSSCAFDENAVLIAAGTLSRRLASSGWNPRAVRYHVFFPGLLKAMRPLEVWLGWLPLGGQYSVVARK